MDDADDLWCSGSTAAVLAYFRIGRDQRVLMNGVREFVAHVRRSRDRSQERWDKGLPPAG